MLDYETFIVCPPGVDYMDTVPQAIRNEYATYVDNQLGSGNYIIPMNVFLQYPHIKRMLLHMHVTQIIEGCTYKDEDVSGYQFYLHPTNQWSFLQQGDALIPVRIKESEYKDGITHVESYTILPNTNAGDFIQHFAAKQSKDTPVSAQGAINAYTTHLQQLQRYNAYFRNVPTTVQQVLANAIDTLIHTLETNLPPVEPINQLKSLITMCNRTMSDSAHMHLAYTSIEELTIVRQLLANEHTAPIGVLCIPEDRTSKS